ncbi:MAG: hypothetical protein ACRCXZ_09470 [Patescibacteria group bacterium]
MHKALEVFQKIYLNFEFSGLMLEFVRLYKEYFLRTGLPLDLTGHQNFVAKIDEIGSTLFVTNSATKPHFSYSSFKKERKQGSNCMELN